jgi:hypothetical protein
MVARAPRKRMYRTMQGRMVDIEKLRAANEGVQAVGNMNVNAKGDVLGPGGVIVKPKSEVIAKYYEHPKGMVDDTPSRNKKAPAAVTKPEPTKTTVKKMTPVVSKSDTKKPQPVPANKDESKTMDTFKPKTESTIKGGIDEALDGLE